MANKVIIMRGAPGSGKSTYTKKNYPDAVVVSADHFFEQPDGTYIFDRSKISAAHAACLRRFTQNVEFGTCGDQGEGRDSCLGTAYCGQSHRDIVVDNTNISAVEIAPYAALALAYGWELEIVTLDVDPKTSHARNVHSVPEKTVKDMHKRLTSEEARFPRYWSRKTVDNQSPSQGEE